MPEEEAGHADLAAAAGAERPLWAYIRTGRGMRFGARGSWVLSWCRSAGIAAADSQLGVTRRLIGADLNRR